MKILICGMPRSMTTWAFNIIRELLSNKNVKTLWIGPNDDQAESDFITSDTDVLAKCHHYSEALASSSDLIIYSYRDIRTAAVSYHRKFESSCNSGQLDAWIANGVAWSRQAHTVLRYESVEGQPLEAISSLRKLIRKRCGESAVVVISDAEVLRRVDAEFHLRQAPDVLNYDSLTMITPRHRTFQPIPTHLSIEEKSLYDRVEHDFSGWLKDFGYIHGNDHGQELEYQITSIFFKTFNAPTVIDVGVELGSFTQLACESGAAKVIGFEPLPRHFEYLKHKFAGVYQVEIHPVAISNQSGKAQLHVATDLDGNELDFHHTLSDLGDSATVLRNSKTIEVQTRSLADLCVHGFFPNEIDFLKIDTDGHDLSVLKGLGNLRPKIILAEYWDTLPNTSGKNIYSLYDMASWALSHDYTRMIVVRRNGRLEQVQLNAPWTIAGDWGNVFFLRDDFNYESVKSDIDACAAHAYRDLCKYVVGLINEIEEKEAEIQHMAAAMRQIAHSNSMDKAEFISYESKQAKQLLENNIGTTNKIVDENEKIRHLTLEVLECNRELVEKEEVIRTLSKAVLAYRLAYMATKPLNVLLSPIYFLAKFASEKIGVLLSPLHTISRHGKAMLRPRLGNLNQYPPRPLSKLINKSSHRTLRDTPKISIVTPSYNQGLFIERTLVSILDQNYSNLEYFVQDGNSKDETINILKKYEEKLSGWVSEEDEGQSQAINRGFLKTSGDIMAWLNSDDLLLPGAFSVVVEYFESHPEVDVVYGNRLLIDENDLEIGRWILPGHDSAVLSWVDYVPQETLFWRRRIWEKVDSQIDESFKFAMDWDLLVRFRDAGAEFAHIPEFIGAFRIHEHQKTSANINEIGQQEMDRIRLRLLGALPTYKQIRRAAMPYMLKHIIFDFGYRLKERLI